MISLRTMPAKFWNCSLNPVTFLYPMKIFQRLNKSGFLSDREVTFRQEQFDPNAEGTPEELRLVSNSLQFGQTSKAIHADNRIYFVRRAADHKTAKAIRTKKAEERVYVAKRRLLEINLKEASTKFEIAVKKARQASQAGLSKEELADYYNQAKLVSFERDRAHTLLEKFDAERQLNLLLPLNQIGSQSHTDTSIALELAKAKAALKTLRQQYTDDHPKVRSQQSLVDELSGINQRHK